MRGRETAAVLEELCEALVRGGRVPDRAKFLQLVLNRESLMGSNWEAGMAFPHARLAELNELAFAVGRSEEPLHWGAKGTGVVRLVFLIAIPLDQSEQYLSLISGLARLSKAAEMVEKTHRSNSALEIFELLQQIQLRPERTPKSASKAVVAAK